VIASIHQVKKGLQMQYIKFFDAISMNDTATVGGKNASLGEMYTNLTHLDIKVPNGFAITSDAYWLILQENGLKKEIQQTLENVDISNIAQLEKKGDHLRNLIRHATLPTPLQNEIIKAYRLLSQTYGTTHADVAVRSSGTAEDLPDASFAGQQETFLNINSEEALLKAVQACYASLFTNRAISYRQSRGYDHLKVALSIGIQKMVRSDKASSGVMFTLDTQSESDKLVMINSIYGIGENIVGGKVTPDEFLVYKPLLKEDHPAILKRQLGNKHIKMVYNQNGSTTDVNTSTQEHHTFSLTDEEILQLAAYGMTIESHYSTLADTYRPMDIEWAKDGETGELFIVQARPETVISQKLQSSQANLLELYKFKETTKKKKVLITGNAIGEKIGAGKIRIIHNLSQAKSFQEGEVLVTHITDPDWEPIMKKASAVITDKGGRTCHAAIVAREIGVPAIVGCGEATQQLQNTQEVTVSCSQGEVGYVYEGLWEYDVETTSFENLKPTQTKLYVNVGNPQNAFHVARLPNEGVGLARMEFIINNYIKAHPMALVHMHQGNPVEDEATIHSFMQGYSDPKRFFIQKLAEGVATIAAAFYPKPVIVRTSDFKSNEYKLMPGGAPFERDEENPMIGFRGASRYYSEGYKEAFMWECEALKYVRDTMGLTNVKLMLPFVRTPEEGKKVISIMNQQGLVQGKNGLEVYAMCEIPSNVIFADAFLNIFDGYSIGSNDLTQLTLGVDRDSELIAHIFDERDESVKRMLKLAIDACKKEGKYIGICGQAPSDYPEITEFLVENKIDSISLNPDSVYKMWQVVETLEGG
jgi:pyruvate,water dikinase